MKYNGSIRFGNVFGVTFYVTECYGELFINIFRPNRAQQSRVNNAP